MSRRTQTASEPPFSARLVASGAPIDRSRTLGAICFGEDATRTDALFVPIPQLADTPLDEIWSAREVVSERTAGDLQLRFSSDVLFGSVSFSNMGQIDEVARAAYSSIAEAIRDAGYPHLVRMWNHVSRINEEDEGLERYKRFCVGRHEGFAAAGAGDRAYPAASGVGSDRLNDLVTYFIAAKRKPLHVENPRQLAAYQYPVRYGPKSPSFARATVLEWPEESQLFISGTASVVGHESVHIGDLDRQVDETMRNIDALIESAGRMAARSFDGLKSIEMLKVYVRRAEDYEQISARLRSFVDAPTLFLRSDICRAELLVEIEGIAITR